MLKQRYPVKRSQAKGLYMLQICIKPFEFHANNDLTNKVVSRFCSSATNGSRSRGPIVLTIALSQSITYM